MKAFCLVLIIGLIFSKSIHASTQGTLRFPLQNQTPLYSSSALDPEIDSDDVYAMSVCCPVRPAPSCGWGDFPIGSECYCSYAGQIYPGTVCGK
ncbi:hypothetical protein [Bdellovibrio sp. ZAP7]|uniref:hypothetical protein n=1 Tax=Bdellovibrio sp. ZAP7 TaxID=2231053 RepID=UPI00143DBE88|nr:hypothetical protein [Bdellovibrio sp. ZAP7]